MLIPIGFLGAGGASGAYELISTAYGTGSNSTISFASIPSTYKHLQIRYASVLTTNSGGDLSLRFNGVSGSSYSYHLLLGNGSIVYSGAGSNAAQIYLFGIGYAAQGTTPTAGICDIVDYASTSKNKTVRNFVGQYPATGNKEVSMFTGGFYSTNAVTSIELATNSGSFATSARFSLYGIKG